jgi:transposase
MVVVGSDVHKRTHTFVAVDGVGRKLAEVTVSADHRGHDRAIRWAREKFGQGGEAIRWAVEDCRHLSARLEIDLLEAGEQVVRVPPKLMAEQRRLAAPGVSPTRSMPWPWPAPRCGSRTCPPPRTTNGPGSCGCWWIGVRTWSPSGPG